MPAKKAGRQQVKRALRNRSARTETRSTLVKANRAIAGGDPEEAAAALRNASRLLDRAVQKGILHRNNASRRKSRLAARLNKLAQDA